ncbi:MAG: hydroxyacylglutathione hydrolase [Ottowia sp.]|nr:hydroxyacylglutathione hydrolase [Ottowia sp.]
MQSLRVESVPIFKDNYVWVISNAQSAVVVDPGESAPVIDYLHDHQLTLGAIVITHHHADHIGGIDGLLRATSNVPVYGPADEYIDLLTHRLHPNDVVPLPSLNEQLHVIAVPGHTAGHIAYYLSDKTGQTGVFCGDTLFATGCGKLFEGTAAQMVASLRALSALPTDTKVYCAHEYTLSNIRFALAVEPSNVDLQHWERQAQQLRSQGRPTIPTTIAHELRTNPFLRCQHASVIAAAQRHTGDILKDEVAVLAALREWKNIF